MSRRVLVEDLLSGREAAELAGIGYGYMRERLRRKGGFPAPVRVRPVLWVREDVLAWRRARAASPGSPVDRS